MSRTGQRPPPKWDQLYRVAAPQGGFFSLAQAREIGYSAPLIEYHHKVGHLERAGRGIFRLSQFPTGEHEDLIVTWLWSERRGVFSHETALALHDLSDALPSKQHLTLPTAWKRRRLRVPPGVVLQHADLPEQDVAWMGPVPLTSPLRTVVDCAVGDVEPTLIRQAKTQAMRRGLFTKADISIERCARPRRERQGSIQIARGIQAVARRAYPPDVP